MSNDLIELIIECTIDDKTENLIKGLGKVKYKLPSINSYVIEINKEYVNKLNGIAGIKALYENSHITAQMNSARNVVNYNSAKNIGLSGKNIGIAILDTGICPVNDLIKPTNRIIAFKDFVNNKVTPYDDNGHGTHVAGISCGNGFNSNGLYSGIAYNSNIIGVKILDKKGSGNTSQVLAGIQWIIDNKTRYNIRIANLSIGSPASPKISDPLIRAVNAAWDTGIIMTIAAGNNGPGKSTITSPGVSKKVITVGSSDDSANVSIWGNFLKDFSGRGPTYECIFKPDIVAPGSDIISCLTSTPYEKYEVIDNYYTKLSGTSMSTPVVSGAISLLLEKNPNLTPNEVKYKLKFSAVDLGYSQNHQGWGLLDIQKLIS